MIETNKPELSNSFLEYFKELGKEIKKSSQTQKKEEIFQEICRMISWHLFGNRDTDTFKVFSVPVEILEKL